MIREKEHLRPQGGGRYSRSRTDHPEPDPGVSGLRRVVKGGGSGLPVSVDVEDGKGLY